MLAFVFPGQGSQSVGMLADLAGSHPTVRHTFEEASSVLGYDLWKLVQEGPADDLNATQRTQPAMLAAGVAVWRVWREAGGPMPEAMAGHSLGEYTALVCADAMDYGETVALVADRGRFMQEAVPAGTGAMAALLGLGDDEVVDLCQSTAGEQVVSAVNFNAPGQVVIAGHVEAVDRAIELAREAGARRALKLPVSVPSHCDLMRPAAERLAERLAGVDVRTPSIPIIHNVDVSGHEDPERLRDVLARQLHSPVRWVETVRVLGARGVDTVVECGPGKVLAGLNKRIDRGMGTVPVFDDDGIRKAMDTCLVAG